MLDLTTLQNELAWPLTILIAWTAGEFAYSWLRLPRISAYAVVGFLLAPSQLGLLPSTPFPMMLVIANIAFGLILFESGYRINLRWLRDNPWLTAASLTEASLTFISVYLLALVFNQETITALLLAALSMASSPATILRGIHEQKSSGQVTERSLHLSVLNCVLAVFIFKIVVGLEIFKTSGDLWNAAYNSIIALIISAFIGAGFGIVIPGILRLSKRLHQDGTLAFTIAVILIVALTHSLKLSPVLATLTFGLFVRHRRIVLNASQRGFGAIGDLLAVMMFVFIATTIEWRQVLMGMSMGFAILAVRLLCKVFGIGIFSRVSGISWRKGALVGLASMPISAFVILVLEQTRFIGINFVDQLAPLATAAIILEIFGPILLQKVLIWAHEVPENKGV
ncbi:MAG: sodium:proton antiporter [Burkholderiaceae bacterium]|nr:MAG: sodium:proton antiporter [Burkholderiaceae bacterium]